MGDYDTTSTVHLRPFCLDGTQITGFWRRLSTRVTSDNWIAHPLIFGGGYKYMRQLLDLKPTTHNLGLFCYTVYNSGCTLIFVKESRLTSKVWSTLISKFGCFRVIARVNLSGYLGCIMQPNPGLNIAEYLNLYIKWTVLIPIIIKLSISHSTKWMLNLKLYDNDRDPVIFIIYKKIEIWN